MSNKKVIRIYTKDKSEIEDITNKVYLDLIKHFNNDSTKRVVGVGFKFGGIYNSNFEIHINKYDGDIEKGKCADVVVLSGWTPSKHEYENVLFPMVFGKNGNIVSYICFNKLLSNGYMIDYLSKGGDNID